MEYDLECVEKVLKSYVELSFWKDITVSVDGCVRRAMQPVLTSVWHVVNSARQSIRDSINEI